MRIYKTRKDFTALNTAGNPGVFAGTVCTITDEVANPMYIFQGGKWNINVSTSVDLVNGQWQTIPSIFRLQMTGTGTVTLDSMDALGNITLSVYTVTISGAINQIGFPYAGDAAISIRATLTGTATAKVI